MQERRDQIIKLINDEGQITFGKLKQQFPEVSDMTLRTDLKCLDESGMIIRIHGGARSIDSIAGTDGLFNIRATRKPAQKEEIAKKAVSLIAANSSIFIDSGSTTTLFCHELPDDVYEIYTSGLSCATELAELKMPHVHVLGGKMNRFSLSTSGGEALVQMQHYHFNICVIGVTSFSPDFGFSCESEDDCLLKRVAISNSDHVMILMDSSKFGPTNTHQICTLKEVDTIVTDSGMNQDQRSYFENKKIQVI